MLSQGQNIAKGLLLAFKGTLKAEKRYCRALKNDIRSFQNGSLKISNFLDNDRDYDDD